MATNRSHVIHMAAGMERSRTLLAALHFKQQKSHHAQKYPTQAFLHCVLLLVASRDGSCVIDNHVSVAARVGGAWQQQRATALQVVFVLLLLSQPPCQSALQSQWYLCSALLLVHVVWLLIVPATPVAVAIRILGTMSKVHSNGVVPDNGLLPQQ